MVEIQIKGFIEKKVIEREIDKINKSLKRLTNKDIAVSISYINIGGAHIIEGIFLDHKIYDLFNECVNKNEVIRLIKRIYRVSNEWKGRIFYD